MSLRCPCHSPDAADSTSFDVQLGDIILTATDGLFDNMPDYMILQELKKLKVIKGWPLETVTLSGQLIFINSIALSLFVVLERTIL